MQAVLQVVLVSNKIHGTVKVTCKIIVEKTCINADAEVEQH